MKKIILSAIIIASFTPTTKAQTGTLLVYGNVGLTKSKDTYGNKTTLFNINPAIGYQFNDHFTTGIGFGYNQNKVIYASYPSTPSNSINSYSVGPFVRYSESISSLFGFYAQFAADYTHGHNDNNTGGNYNFPTISNGFEASLFPAIFLNIKNGFALNFSVGGIDYNTVKIKGVSTSTNTFTFNFGQAPSIGISKNFGGKKSHS